jgi:hypothetical protein
VSVVIALARRAAAHPTFADLNLRVVDMLGDLTEIAHVEPSRTDRAFHEVIGLMSLDYFS